MRPTPHHISAVLLVFSAVLVTACGRFPEPAAPVEVGSSAPHLTLPSLDGSEVDLRSFLGSRVVLSFWASWCQPCRGEIPELQALHRAPGVEVVTVALDEEGAATVEPFVTDQGIEYRVLLGDQEAFERFRGYTIPYTLVLDEFLHIETIIRGPLSEEDLSRIDRGSSTSALGAASGGSR